MEGPVNQTARAIVALGLLAVASACGSNSASPLQNAGGPPAYEWNQPFLAWPDTGDLVCETEEGPCGSPYATLDPTRKATGTPLRIASLRVEVGKLGHHELVIGRLAFAAGVHSSTSFRIVNGDTRVFRVAQTHVEFRSLRPGAPPFTEVARDRPRVDGVEPVEAVLVWDTDFAVDGAVMEIADLVID
jgi:hypothetical protein